MAEHPWPSRVPMAIDYLVGLDAVVVGCTHVLVTSAARMDLTHPMDRPIRFGGLDVARCPHGPWGWLGRCDPLAWFFTLDGFDRD